MSKAKFGFGDFITLAKSGWTPEAVNKTLDRLEALGAEDSNDDSGAEGAEGSDDSNDDANNNNNNDDSGAEGAEGSDDSESEKDAEIAKLKQQLAEAQKANRQQNNDTGDKKTIDEMVDDIFKDYFD